MLPSARPIALCADDYGYRPGVSAAIRRLAANRRLSATSALVTFPEWSRAAPYVDDLAAQIDVGLHLNLVDGAPLGKMAKLAPSQRFPTIGALALRALLGQLPLGEIRDEILRQIEAFHRASGRLPDFIDGHQHAHALSGISEVVVQIASELNPDRLVPVRNPSETLPRIFQRRTALFKASVIALLTRPLAPQARQRGVPINDGFSGVYDFAPRTELEVVFSDFLSCTGARPLIMCHPGDAEPTYDVDDPIIAARCNEAEFLASDAFAKLVQEKGLALARFTELAA